MSGRKNENVSEGQEPFEELSLGRALACLDEEDARQQHSPLFIRPNDVILTSLRERRNQLRAQALLVQELLQTIPECGCESDVAFLAGTPDFFLVNFTNQHPAATESLDNFTRFFKHMNNCYRCFEEYSLVLRDYYHTKQELRGHGATATTN